MDKIPFNISAAKQGAKALIRITGEIGWDTSAEGFRRQVDDLVAEGVKDAHVYINSPGGSCFDASEIVNIMSAFPGDITGEGGALVASAATFIALHCKSFIMPENGMYMIHKPHSGVYGTASEVESKLKMLQVVEQQYLDAYKAKSTNVSELETRWNSGDWWMTATEARDNGFISGVKDKIQLDRQAAAMITACGCPASKIPLIHNDKHETDMDLRTTAKALGLPENATEEQVNAAIAAGCKARTDLADLRAEQERKTREERTQKIKAEVKAAAADKRITADNIPMWEEALQADYDKNSKLLASLAPVAKIPTNPGKKNSTSGKATHDGKTFEELQDQDPEALATLMDDDPEAYDAIYEDYLKRNKLNR